MGLVVGIAISCKVGAMVSFLFLFALLLFR